MRMSHSLVYGLISLVFIFGTMEVLRPTASQAGRNGNTEGPEKVNEKPIPPCGQGTRAQRFVLVAGGTEVCDNTTGRHWEQSPSTVSVNHADAIKHCDDLLLNGRTWRLATTKELISLRDVRAPIPADALNSPNGPFANVQTFLYWSHDESIAIGPWIVHFDHNDVGKSPASRERFAWCVR